MRWLIVSRYNRDRLFNTIHEALDFISSDSEVEGCEIDHKNKVIYVSYIRLNDD